MAAVSTSRERRLRDAATKCRLFFSSSFAKPVANDARVDVLVHVVEQLTITLHSFLFTALPAWQLAPTAWGNLSVPADTGSADDPTSYASPFNANASELCSDADNLLGLLHFPAEPAVIAPLEPTAAAITAKLQNWAPSNTDLFLDGSKLGAELANEAATLIQQAFRVWSGGVSYFRQV